MSDGWVEAAACARSRRRPRSRFSGSGRCCSAPSSSPQMYDQHLVAFDVHQSIRPAAELLVDGRPYRTDEAVIAAGGAHPYPPFVTFSPYAGDTGLGGRRRRGADRTAHPAGTGHPSRPACARLALLRGGAPLGAGDGGRPDGEPFAAARLLAALAWRFRDSRWTALPSAAAMGRRRSVAARGVAGATGRVPSCDLDRRRAGALVLRSFALIGIGSISDYLDVCGWWVSARLRRR